MSTLKELLKDKELGKVKVRKRGWRDGLYFVPMYYLDGSYFGHNNFLKSEDFLADENMQWELYYEPKKKVKMYLYAYLGPVRVEISNMFYKNNEDFLSQFVGEPAFYKKLEWSEIEVEE